jgi:hypothetical protein
MIRALYKPFGMLASVAGGLLAGMLFRFIWRHVAHDDQAPEATDHDRGWAEIITAAALQGALFGGVKAIIDRAGAKGFERATGTWPGGDHTK